jgi:hypothetical protein
MSDQLNQSQSQNSFDSGSNGGLGDATNMEPKKKPPYTHREYVLEDFSQQRINRGQQKINYLITVAGERIVDALNQVSSALAKIEAGGQVNVEPLEEAIKEVSRATKEIAGEFPPGCGLYPQ